MSEQCYVPNSIVNGILCNVVHTTSKWHSLQFIEHTCGIKYVVTGI